jgi:hypothetical protein
MDVKRGQELSGNLPSMRAVIPYVHSMWPLNPVSMADARMWAFVQISTSVSGHHWCGVPPTPLSMMVA